MNLPEVRRPQAGLAAYDILWRGIGVLARGLGRVKPAIRSQLEERQWDPQRLEGWREARKKARSCYVFFCSSAGEYEQAKPLIKRLCADGSTFVLIIFVSPSGTRFARSQKESLPYFLAPGDRPGIWEDLAEALRPDAWIVVRYELWPGFLAVAKRWAPIYLVDAVAAPSLQKSASARWLRRSLLASVNSIFTVAAADKKFFADVLNIDEKKLVVAGDTKYDRVLERVEERKAQFEDLKRQLQEFLSGARVLVMGSAWPDDVRAFAPIYAELKAFDPKIKLIIAPHDLSAANLESIEKELSGMQMCRVSREGFTSAKAHHDALFVDSIGVLPELYGLGHVAWVGGAMHFRVHNVLEPACRGIYVCFGPLFETSQEARALVAQGLAQVIGSGREFLDWYKNLNWASHPPHQRLWQMVSQQQGASDRIVAQTRAPRRS